MINYEPELGQSCFGNPTGEYEVSEVGKACVEHILKEVSRTFWNNNQKEWDTYVSPEFESIDIQPYYWGDDEELKKRPNLKFGDVEIRWYKHPGRGLSVNKPMTPDDWHLWLNAVIEAIRKQDVK